MPPLVSVTEKIDRPDHEPPIFLKSPCGEFGVHEALDFWQQSAERFVLGAFDAVATATVEPVFTDGHPVEVTRLRITDAGRRALTER